MSYIYYNCLEIQLKVQYSKHLKNNKLSDLLTANDFVHITSENCHSKHTILPKAVAFIIEIVKFNVWFEMFCISVILLPVCIEYMYVLKDWNYGDISVSQCWPH